MVPEAKDEAALAITVSTTDNIIDSRIEVRQGAESCDHFFSHVSIMFLFISKACPKPVSDTLPRHQNWHIQRDFSNKRRSMESIRLFEGGV